MTSLTDGRREQDDSGEYSDASQDIENSGNDGGQPESDYDSEGSDSERSEGDPEKQETERRVDDDEDRSNPQYIPKRGTFYEHDDRTAASGEESTNTTAETPTEKKEGPETPTERRRPPRKSESLNKWSHDKYNENEQMPKSRDELVSIYGYDIRNEDAPPHARRNRRYGRGPNKYTRTWEDEEAYKRQTLQTPNKKPPSPADFPELSAANRPGRRSRVRPRSKSQPASNDSSENGSLLRRNASIKTPKQKPVKQNTPKTAPKQMINKMADKLTLEKLTITTNVNNQGPPQRRVNAVAQIVPVPTNQSTDPGKRKLLPAQPPPSTLQTQSNTQKQQKPQQRQQQNTTGGAEKSGGSKRYSSLRQRPLAETYSPQQPQPQPTSQQQQQQPPQTQPVPQAQTQPQPTPQPTPQQQPQPTPQQPQQQHRYHGEFAGQSAPHQPQQHQGSPAPQIHQQMIHPQVHRNAVNQPPHGPSPPHQPLPQPPQHAQQQVRLGIIEQQQIVPHPHHTMHNLPQPHQIGQIQQSQGYAPPAMMPAQYMQPQSATGGVFNPPPMYQPAPAYPHQLYQHHNYGTQAGGVTYYSCAEQETASRPHRRPTAAIPIVKPNHLVGEAGQERPVNSSEKDNIDRIVENMFVRKPWPGTAANDASKDKSERSSQEPQSKDTSQPSSLTSSVSTDSKTEKTEKEITKEKEPERTEDA